jgi:ppGpp synthetase/RelA/SpoT-type nucleotidyltranferase
MQLTAQYLRTAEEAEKPKRSFRGLPIVIEDPKGSIRKGVDLGGRAWEREMKVDYGYIPQTTAAGDEENVDVYVGDDENAEYAYVVEQVLENGDFDEYKVMLGFPTLEAAEEMYQQHGPDKWDGIGDIYEVPLEYLFDAVKEHQKTAADPDLIEKFVQQYERQRRLYSKAADVVRGEINDACIRQNIRAAITARAKTSESLRNKLTKRNAARPYQGVKDILYDIKDMAGVRVALYFPIDRAAVGKIIDELYDQARPPKNFPEDREPGEPDGYEATHFAVKYAGLVVEIQVASALMYAWAEVSHDLIYKPRMGQLTQAEYQLLDELKAIVSAGEHTVTQLQELVQSRVASIPSEARRVATSLYVTAILSARDRILASVEKV